MYLEEMKHLCRKKLILLCILNFMCFALFLPSVSLSLNENAVLPSYWNPYQPYVSIGGIKYFHQSSKGAGVYDLFFPLFSSHTNHLVFSNVRIFDRTGSTFEGNAHLGFRYFIPPNKQIVGIYASFDRKRSEHKEYFNQITFGGEYWENKWFMGGNIYFSVGRKKKPIRQIVEKTERQTEKSRYVIIETNFEKKTFYEKSLSGIDLETGYAFSDSFITYLGAYWFQDGFFKAPKEREAPTVFGPKLRLVYDYQPLAAKKIFEVLDGISLEGGIQYDRPRKSSAYIGLKLKVGLSSQERVSYLSGFSKHMVELVRRDPDIVLGQGETSKTSSSKKIFYQEGEQGFRVTRCSQTEKEYSERTDYDNWAKSKLLEELGLSEESQWDEVKQTYRRLSRIYHPDKTKDDGSKQARLNGIHEALKQRFSTQEEDKIALTSRTDSSSFPHSTPLLDSAKNTVTETTRTFSTRSVILSKKNLQYSSIKELSYPPQNVFERGSKSKLAQNTALLSHPKPDEIPEIGGILFWLKNTMVTLGNSFSAFNFLPVARAEEIKQSGKNKEDPLLFSYADSGNLKKVIFLLNQGVNPDQAMPNNGATGLMFASQNGHLDVVKAFLNAGAQPNQAMHDGKTPLMFASEGGYLDIATVLLKQGADPNQKNHHDVVALMLAAQKGHLHIVEELLVHKANPNDETSNGATALSIVMSTNKRFDIVNTLIRYGATPGLDQLRLIFNLSLFLEKYNEGTEGKMYDDDFIKKFKSEIGFCNGLTLLYHYSKWLQTQPRNMKGYDYDWFIETTQSIAAWNGIEDLGEKDVRNMRFFISTITFFQNPVMYYSLPLTQVNLGRLISVSLLDTIGKQLKQEYSIASSFTLEKLSIFLKQVLHVEKLITIYYYNHVVGLFRDKDHFYYYNSNDLEGEIRYSSTDEIAEKIFRFNAMNYGEMSPIGFLVSGFQKHIQTYPQQSEFLTYSDDSPKNYCPLCLAAMIGASEAVDYFLEVGKNPNELDRERSSALILASKQGHTSIVRRLLRERADPKIENRFDRTALMVAAQDGQVEVIDTLIERGINPNQSNHKGMTALMLASQDNQGDVVKKLLGKGANPDQAMSNGIRALMVASQNGHTDIVRVLLKAGANPNLRMSNGVTALMLASQYNRTHAVKDLLIFGADPNLTIDKGYTALDLASEEEIKTLLTAAMHKGFFNNLVSLFRSNVVPLAVTSVLISFPIIYYVYKGRV